MKETPISETVYTVMELKTGSEYQFRVSAENVAGVGEPSQASDAKVAKPPYGKLRMGWNVMALYSCSSS